MAEPQDKPERSLNAQGGKLDEASEESFPASDPPARSGITGPGAPESGTDSPGTDIPGIDSPGIDSPGADPWAGSGGGDAHADEAKGTPHTDRHASETAAGRIDSTQPAERKPS